jgi:hypothetical protein
MYDLKKIADCIKSPDRMMSQDIELFKKLSEEFADTPIFNILFLQAVSRFDSLSFEKNLKRHAYKIPSRKRLFELIEEIKLLETNQLKPIPETPLNDDRIEEVVTENEEKESDANSNSIDSASNSEKIEDTTQDALLKNDDDIDLSVIEKEVAIDSEDNQSEHKLDDHSFDVLEKEMMAHAVGASISLEVDEFISQERMQTQNSDEIDSKEEDAIEVNDVEQESTQSEVDFSEARSFTEWLNITSDQEILDKSTSDETKDSKKKKKSEIKLTEKKVSKPFFSAVEKAKESLDYTGIPITETLAKIYDAQGNYPRALEAYEQLILKIPEKKVFFAIQIEKLKKKINN